LTKGFPSAPATRWLPATQEIPRRVVKRQTHPKTPGENNENPLPTCHCGIGNRLCCAGLCPTKRHGCDPEITQKIRAISKGYDEAANNNNAAGIAALFTEDAVFVTDGGPVYGRQAIEKWYEAVFQQVHITNHIGKADQGCPHIKVRLPMR
jgi:hypothetical protein